MTWFVKTLVSAMVAGVGGKMGVDGYETVKRAVKERVKGSEEAAASEDAVEIGAAATGAEVVYASKGVTERRAGGV